MHIQQPLFSPKATWQPPRLDSLPSWKGAGRVAIDVETKDPQLKELGPGPRRGGHTVGFAFAIEDGPKHYLPYGHTGGDNLSRDAVFAYLRDQAREFTGLLVGHNLSYDVDYCEQEGVHFKNVKGWRDTQVAEPLLDELQNSYSLDSVAKRHGLPGKVEQVLRDAASAYNLDPKGQLHVLPARFVGAYAEGDVALPLVLMRRQERMIEEQELQGIFDMESRLTPVLLAMRRRGVRIDLKRLDYVERWALQQELEKLAEIKRLTGISLAPTDVWSAEALAPVLRHLGVSVPLTPKTQKPSIDKFLLKKVAKPETELLMAARKFNKLRTTFVASIRRYVVGDRLHATFNQMRRSSDSDEEGEEDNGARYGRLSSSDPNVQQQPARDPEIGPIWRSIYIPEDGEKWACQDYSQQEPRWFVHYAALTNCPGGKAALAQYINNPKMDYHSMMESITGIPRKRAKDIFLGRCYGMGDAKLCKTVGVPTKWIQSRRDPTKMFEVAGPEGEAMIQKFDTMAPFVKGLTDKVTAAVQARGYIVTGGGRRCRFPKLPDGSYDWAHKGVNRLIQGTSADQTKWAVTLAGEADIPITLQVHDEIDLSVPNREATYQLVEIMKTCLPCSVPARVDTELGPNWGEIK